MALAESLINAWVESSGGLASDKTLIEQGVSKIAKTKGGRFLQKWINDFTHEMLEEGVQSGVSSGFETAAGLKTTTYQQEFGSAEATAATTASVALMTAIFTLAGMGADVDPIIVQYEQGNLDKTKVLTTEAIDSALESGTLSEEEADSLDKIQNKIKAAETESSNRANPFVDNKLQAGDIRAPGLSDIEKKMGTPKSISLTPEQIEQSVQEDIKNHVQTQPQVVQNALVEGMSTLVKIESRLKAESRNVNYSGFNVDVSQAAYMDFQTAKGTAKAASLHEAAHAMAADIRAAFETGQLSETEATQLKGIAAEIVGDARLAEAYVGTKLMESDGRNNAKVMLELQQSELSIGETKLVQKIKDIGDNLFDIMESSGGHTVDRHIGKSVEYLTERAKTLKGKGASSYYDKSVATRAVQDTISQHSEEIFDWLYNSNEPRLTVNAKHLFEVGNGVRRGTEMLINGLVHTTTILKRSQNSLGFIIITSYPVFN